jgi:hypothetical protein
LREGPDGPPGGDDPVQDGVVLGAERFNHVRPPPDIDDILIHTRIRRITL